MEHPTRVFASDLLRDRGHSERWRRMTSLDVRDATPAERTAVEAPGDGELTNARTEQDRHCIPTHAWHASLRPGILKAPTPNQPYRVAQLADTPADLEQPALLDDVICLHLGGAKRVHRTRASQTAVYDVPPDALTLMPRWQENRWLTEGPNAYVHLVVTPRSLDEITAAEFGRSRDEFDLDGKVGLVHPLAARLAEELVLLDASDSCGRLYREGVFTAFVLTLLRTHSSLRVTDRSAHENGHGGLAAWKLRRVLDFMQENRANDIGYDELTSLTKVSRSHFFRAFKNSTGMTPGRYLEQVRVNHARTALERGRPFEEAAREGGFKGTRDMSRAFLRRFGFTPTEYRRWYGS